MCVDITSKDIETLECIYQNCRYTDPYGIACRFALLWILYNEKYNKNSSNASNHDKEKFKEFFCRAGGRYYNDNKEQIIGDFRETKLSDGSPRASVQNLGYGGDVDFSESHESIEILADVIYTIRCNLLHGDKGTTLSESDKKLVPWASDVLYRVLKHYHSIQNRRGTL